MLIHSLCDKCYQSFKLVLEPADLELVKQVSDAQGFSAPCPKLCGGRINLVGNPSWGGIRFYAGDAMTVTGKEFYKAVMGGGLPQELPKSAGEIESILKSGKITDMLMEVYNDQVYLHELEIDKETIIHLCSGAKGAQILKITKRHKDG